MQRSGTDTVTTTPDPGYQWESNKLTVRHHKRQPRGQPLPSSQNMTGNIGKMKITAVFSLCIDIVLIFFSYSGPSGILGSDGKRNTA